MDDETVVENCVWFTIYKVSPYTTKDDAHQQSDDGSWVEEVNKHVIERLTRWTHSDNDGTVRRYIWQRDVMKCVGTNTWNICGEGCVRFDDVMDDEWFVVWILREISKAYPDVAIRVWDNDGEFLLIEAAYSLPDWLEPDIAENRVWIYRGSVHCIPCDVMAQEEQDDGGGIERALRALCEHESVALACGKGIDACISSKIDMYPEYARDTMHRAPVYVSGGVAELLHKDPQCVSRAARAFQRSGAKDKMKASKTLAMSEYTTNGENGIVPILVQFNRFWYSQLVFSEYKAPKDSPWNQHASIHQSKIPEWIATALDIGHKLMIGFTLCYPHVHGSSGKQDQYTTTIIDVDTTSQAVYPGDDDSWLYEPSQYLEEEISRREDEFGTEFNPDELSRRMKQFVDTMSSMEGAVVKDEEISFDPDMFLDILSGNRQAPSEDEGSSFYEGESTCSDDLGDDPICVDPRCRVQVDTETDSDDDYEEYEQSLARELQNTSLHQDDGDTTAEPVDIDVNLVSHLLSSYSGEQGLEPGPASTLAGLLGVSLPRMKHSTE
jgi:hypothetical protein